jgi:hypothetical protein
VTVAAPQQDGWSPALRLLADRGRRTTRRVPAVAGALGARLAERRAYTIWPSVARPQFAADVGHPASAAWLRETFEPGARKARFTDAATWSALRTRGVLFGGPSRTLTDALAAAGHAGGRVYFALYSPTGTPNSKITCFAFAHGAPRPALVVKAMPEPRLMERLRHETEIVEAIRRHLPGDSQAANALPLRPRFAGMVGGDFVVVQAVDPLAGATGASNDRGTALAWLRAFHASTTRARTPWGAPDTEAELATVRDGWNRARPLAAEAVGARTHELLRALEGRPVDRCAVHGDFWSGNLALRGRRLRVYDWEWARDPGTPFFDLWTWELGPLRRRAELGERDLTDALAAAMERVASELRDRGLDPAFACAMLPGALAELTYRVRWATGMAGGAEAASALLLDGAAAIIGSASG